jgi:hypothetical protein
MLDAERGQCSEPKHTPATFAVSPADLSHRSLHSKIPFPAAGLRRPKTRSLLSNFYVLAILLNRCRQKEGESFAISHGMENYLLRNIACVEVAFFIFLAGI